MVLILLGLIVVLMVFGQLSSALNRTATTLNALADRRAAAAAAAAASGAPAPAAPQRSFHDEMLARMDAACAAAAERGARS